MNRLALITSIMLLTGCSGVTENNVSIPVDNIADTIISATEQENQTSAPNIDPELKDFQEGINMNGYKAGIGYLGYIGYDIKDEKAVCEFINTIPEINFNLGFLKDAPVIDLGGPELYAVVVADEDMTAAVYPAEINTDGTYKTLKEEQVYKTEGISCFILRCNMSEIHSNVSIEFKDKTETFTIHPMLSGMDGRVIDIYNCYDFSLYYDADGEIYDPVINDFNTLLECPEVAYYVSLGMIVDYTGEKEIIDGYECNVFTLGTLHEDYLVREHYYAVYGENIYYYEPIDDLWYKIE